MVGQLKGHSKKQIAEGLEMPSVIEQSLATQLPKILTYTTLTHLIEITSGCSSDEERLVLQLCLLYRTALFSYLCW
ncbi:MAG: hypothetical protein ACTTKF_01695 [Bacteroides sp.]